MIATYGNQLLTLNIGLRRTFQWVFIIADVKNPIIGADFLRRYSLLVDVEHNQLLSYEYKEFLFKNHPLAPHCYHNILLLSLKQYCGTTLQL